MLGCKARAWRSGILHFLMVFNLKTRCCAVPTRHQFAFPSLFTPHSLRSFYFLLLFPSSSQPPSWVAIPLWSTTAAASKIMGNHREERRKERGRAGNVAGCCPLTRLCVFLLLIFSVDMLIPLLSFFSLFRSLSVLWLLARCAPFLVPVSRERRRCRKPLARSSSCPPS